jgi:hypothetical protein
MAYFSYFRPIIGFVSSSFLNCKPKASCKSDIMQVCNQFCGDFIKAGPARGLCPGLLLRQQDELSTFQRCVACTLGFYDLF